MTCRGYDPKAVKVKKSVKRVAATYLDAGLRREIIRGFVKAEQSIMRTRSTRNKGERSD